jgi:LuxR family transcriptional regulator, quorum-sensing system regulator BjaR1
MSGDPARIAFDLIDEFDRMSTPGQLFARMSSVLSSFGYSSLLIGIAPETARDVKRLLLLNGWPPGWTEHYAKAEFYKDDPIVKWTQQSVSPFEWSKVPIRLLEAPRAKHIMKVAKDFGLREGIVVPIFRGDAPVAGVSIAGEQPSLDPRIRRAIHLIALYAHGTIISMQSAESPFAEKILSDGEREVLAWVRDGKSSWEISKILQIAEVTVNWRLQKAMVKLNAVNRVHAVICAIRKKELNL